MKITNEDMINKINMLLSTAKQQLRVIQRDNKKNLIVLNNGHIINDKSDYRNFHTRQKNNINLYDDMYNVDEKKRIDTVFGMKTNARIKGGEACQRKHFDTIRKNLNQGIPWNKGKKGCQQAWNKGLTKENNHSVNMISINHQGIKNPMYGKQLTIEHRKKISNSIKAGILNGTITPNVHNSLTRWNSEYNGKKYRSSWEAIFHCINPNLKYESIRISYHINGDDKIYIVDFEDRENKILYEVKPKEHIKNNKQKMNAAYEWARKNGYEYKLITQEWFIVNKNKILDSDISRDDIQHMQRYLNG